MKIIFDWGELFINAYTRPRLESNNRVHGFYHEEYNLASIAIDIDSINKATTPPHVLPGVVDELTVGSVLIHELCHFALQYGEANKKAKLTSKQEEVVCDAIATVFSHLFHRDIERLITSILKDKTINVQQRKSKGKRKRK